MENPLLSVEKIIVFLIVFLGLGLGFWVFIADRKEKLNQWFAAMAVSVSLWVIFAFLGSLAKEAVKSTFFYRLNFGAVVLFLISAFYFYVIHFLNYKENKKYKFLGKFVLFIGIILISLSVFTDAIIKKTIVETDGTEIIFGLANNFFNIYALSIALLVVGLLIKKYFQLPKPEKLKTQYFLFGTTLFAVFNVIFNIIFPIATKNVAYQRAGDYSAIFLLGFTAYAIIKRKLFGIKVVFTTIFVLAIGTLLFLDTLFFTQELSLQIIKGGGLIIFFILGYSLIQSNSREIKLREELQAANANLDQKIKERTKELEEEKEIAKIQREIAEKKAKKLENWQRTTLTLEKGRESETEELKRKIIELEKKLKERTKEE